MKKILALMSVLAAFLTLSPSAGAREVVPLVEFKDVAVVTGSGKPATVDQVRDAIIAAAAANRWVVIKDSSRDALSATLSSDGRHSIAVSIPYSAEKYSVDYLNSINMKYRLADSGPAVSPDQPIYMQASKPVRDIPAGTPLIHPKYNTWVKILLQSINVELRKL